MKDKKNLNKNLEPTDDLYVKSLQNFDILPSSETKENSTFLQKATVTFFCFVCHYILNQIPLLGIMHSSEYANQFNRRINNPGVRVSASNLNSWPFKAIWMARSIAFSSRVSGDLLLKSILKNVKTPNTRKKVTRGYKIFSMILHSWTKLFLLIFFNKDSSQIKFLTSSKSYFYLALGIGLSSTMGGLILYYLDNYAESKSLSPNLVTNLVQVVDSIQLLEENLYSTINFKRAFSGILILIVGAFLEDFTSERVNLTHPSGVKRYRAYSSSQAIRSASMVADFLRSLIRENVSYTVQLVLSALKGVSFVIFNNDRFFTKLLNLTNPAKLNKLYFTRGLTNIPYMSIPFSWYSDKNWKKIILEVLFHYFMVIPFCLGLLPIISTETFNPEEIAGENQTNQVAVENISGYKNQVSFYESLIERTFTNALFLIPFEIFTSGWYVFGNLTPHHFLHLSSRLSQVYEDLV